jgi:hypothetical protein
MSIGAPQMTEGRNRSLADASNGPSGPLVWQRTDTIGTDLVFQSGTGPRTATGFAVVAGPVPHTTRFSAELDTTWAVRALTVTCEGADWSRDLRLARDRDGTWSCRTRESGDFGRSHADRGHAVPPAPGIEDVDRLAGAEVLRLSDSPIFATWALRHLRLAAGDQPTVAATIRVLTPSLIVVPSRSAYHLVSDRRLRISGGERPTTYEVNPAGLVLAQPARVRLAR